MILEKSFKALILFKLQKSHLLPINKLEAGAQKKETEKRVNNRYDRTRYVGTMDYGGHPHQKINCVLKIWSL